MSRLGLAVRDECGVEAVELLDQCGPGQVRLAPSTQHMEHIMQVRDSPQSIIRMKLARSVMFLCPLL